MSSSSPTFTITPRDQRWDEINASWTGDLYSSAEWLDCLSSAFGLQFEACVSTDEHGTHHWLPYAHIDDLTGERVVSLPFCDVVATMCDHTTWPALAAVVSGSDAPIQLRCQPEHPVCTDSQFALDEAAVWHGRKLEGETDEEILATLAGSARKGVKRARNQGVTVAVRDDLVAMMEFYELHLRLRKERFGLLAQPPALFESMHERFVSRGHGYVVQAHCEGRLASSCVVLTSGETAFYKFSASDPDYRRLGVNDASLYRAICEANARNCHTFDFGRSDLDTPGLIEFKTKFATEASPVVTATRGTLDKSVHRDVLGPLTALFTNQECPTELTGAAGALLYRYFA